jgi:hypothetical protein
VPLLPRARDDLASHPLKMPSVVRAAFRLLSLFRNAVASAHVAGAAAADRGALPSWGRALGHEDQTDDVLSESDQIGSSHPRGAERGGVT